MTTYTIHSSRDIRGFQQFRAEATNLSLDDAAVEMIRLAEEAARSIPNNPTLEITGPMQLSVCIGVYKIISFSLTPHENLPPFHSTLERICHDLNRQPT